MLPALLALSVPRADAFETLKDTLATYEKAKSCRMRIVHEDSTGLFPGKFEQRLEWKGKRFVLKVSVPRTLGGAGLYAPDFYCDGENVFRHSNGELDFDPLDYPENLSPGWEVVGGLPLMAMMRTRNYTRLWTPPSEFGTLSFRGPVESEWKGHKVRRIRMLIDAGDGAVREMANFLLDREKPRLVGATGPKPDEGGGFTMYLDQEFDIELPDTLGDPP